MHKKKAWQQPHTLYSYQHQEATVAAAQESNKQRFFYCNTLTKAARKTKRIRESVSQWSWHVCESTFTFDTTKHFTCGHRAWWANYIVRHSNNRWPQIATTHDAKYHNNTHANDNEDDHYFWRSQVEILFLLFWRGFCFKSFCFKTRYLW
jgi:hypothetical protein